MSWSQIANGNFLENDIACLDDDSTAIIEVSIFQNDLSNGFDPRFNYLLEIDPSYSGKYGSSSITRIEARLNPTFGSLVYDTVMIRYEYHKSENKLDSVRYIVTDYYTQKKDSAFVIMDVGCNTNQAPNKITCDKDQTINTIQDQCYAEYKVVAPTYAPLPNATYSFSSYNGNAASFNIGATVRLDTGTHDRLITFGGQWLEENGSLTMNSCETYIEVQDIQYPEITCPNNITSCTSLVNWDTPTYNDNCEIVNFEQIAGPAPNSYFDDGVTTIEYQVTDNSGLTATCSFDIEVILLPTLEWKNEKNDTTICPDRSAIDLKSQLSEATIGNWSNNTQNGIFNPTNFSENSTETVTFNYLEQSCPITLEYNVTILPKEDLAMQEIKDPICVYHKKINLQNHFSTSPDGVWTIDYAEQLTELNPADYSIGNHTISFNLVDSICPSSFLQTIEITNYQNTDNSISYYCGKSGATDVIIQKEDTIINSNLTLFRNANKLLYEANDFGVYSFEVVHLENFSCSSSKTYLVNIIDQPETSVAGDNIVLDFDQESFTLAANSPNYGVGEWEYNESEILLTTIDEPKTDGKMKDIGESKLVWKIKTGQNCPISSDTIIIRKNDLLVPTAFTPNYDGLNDLLIIDPNDRTTINIEVFNRWGQVLYSNSEYHNDWDGTLPNGNKIAPDTYQLNVSYKNIIKRTNLYIKY